MTPESRFAKHVDRSNLDGCWLWTGYKDKCGYGDFRINGRTVKAHRYAFEMACGPLASDTVLMHICDNPACVRPDHLVPGTHQTNVADRQAKGRSALGARNGRSKIHQRDPQAAEHIRQWYARGLATKTELAGLFGCSPRNITHIVNGTNWRQV